MSKIEDAITELVEDKVQREIENCINYTEIAEEVYDQLDISQIARDVKDEFDGDDIVDMLDMDALVRDVSDNLNINQEIKQAIDEFIDGADDHPYKDERVKRLEDQVEGLKSRVETMENTLKHHSKLWDDLIEFVKTMRS